MKKLPELYIACDVEADGPIPGPYSMISLGMAVAGTLLSWRLPEAEDLIRHVGEEGPEAPPSR